MIPFFPETAGGWLTLTLNVVALILLVRLVAELYATVDRLGRRAARLEDIGAFKAEYDALPLEPVPDPLDEQFQSLEKQVRVRVQQQKQATCKHLHGVTCQEMGSFERVHICNDCGLVSPVRH